MVDFVSLPKTIGANYALRHVAALQQDQKPSPSETQSGQKKSTQQVVEPGADIPSPEFNMMASHDSEFSSISRKDLEEIYFEGAGSNRLLDEINNDDSLPQEEEPGKITRDGLQEPPTRKPNVKNSGKMDGFYELTNTGKKYGLNLVLYDQEKDIQKAMEAEPEPKSEPKAKSKQPDPTTPEEPIEGAYEVGATPLPPREGLSVTLSEFLSLYYKWKTDKKTKNLSWKEMKPVLSGPLEKRPVFELHGYAFKEDEPTEEEKKKQEEARRGKKLDGVLLTPGQEKEARDFAMQMELPVFTPEQLQQLNETRKLQGLRPLYAHTIQEAMNPPPESNELHRKRLEDAISDARLRVPHGYTTFGETFIDQYTWKKEKDHFDIDSDGDLNPDEFLAFAERHDLSDEVIKKYAKTGMTALEYYKLFDEFATLIMWGDSVDSPHSTYAILPFSVDDYKKQHVLGKTIDLSKLFKVKTDKS